MSPQLKLNWRRIWFWVFFVMFCGLLVVILMPAVHPHRISAKPGVEAANLKAVCTAVLFYADDNGFHTPEKLGAVLPYTNGYHRRLFLSPDSPTKPLPVPDPKAPWQSYAMDLEDHCDYWYVVPNVQTDKITAKDKFIMLYAKRNISSGLRNVVFADGHVERLRIEELQKAIDTFNLERQKLGLPEIELDQPVKREKDVVH